LITERKGIQGGQSTGCPIVGEKRGKESIQMGLLPVGGKLLRGLKKVGKQEAEKSMVSYKGGRKTFTQVQKGEKTGKDRPKSSHPESSPILIKGGALKKGTISERKPAPSRTRGRNPFLKRERGCRGVLFARGERRSRGGEGRHAVAKEASNKREKTGFSGCDVAVERFAELEMKKEERKSTTRFGRKHLKKSRTL